MIESGRIDLFYLLFIFIAKTHKVFQKEKTLYFLFWQYSFKYLAMAPIFAEVHYRISVHYEKKTTDIRKPKHRWENRSICAQVKNESYA